MNVEWHLDGDLIHRYGRVSLQGPLLWSVEAHLSSCGACRQRLASSADPAAMSRGWQRLDAAIDPPQVGPVERIILRTGVPEDLARLLAATPALRLSWLAAIAITLLLGVGAGWLSQSVLTPLFLLAVVPLVAVAGVAAFGPRIDPTYEIGLVAPFDSFRLVLLRAAAVHAVTVALAGAASLAVPGSGLRALAWLVPALLVTGAALGMSSLFGPVRAGIVAGGGWVVALATTVRLPSGTSLLFERPAQAVMAGMAAIAILVVAATRSRFDTARTFYASGRR